MNKMCHTRTGGATCVVLAGLLATFALVLMTACHSSEEPVESGLESPLEAPSDDRRRMAHALSEGGSPLEGEEGEGVEEGIGDGGIEAQGIGDGGIEAQGIGDGDIEAQGIGDGGIEAQGIGDGGIGVGSEPEG